MTHFGERRYPFPVPNGWFVVAEAADLAPGEVRALHYFDRDLVLYRTADGDAPGARRPLPPPRRPPGRRRPGRGRLHPLPVPRLEVRRRDGTCVEIPYGDVTRIPPKAHARSYPTLERNHMIWAWYHAEGGEPFYDVPEVAEFHDDDWSPIVVRDFEIRVVGAGHGREQRRLLALPLRARHRRHPRGRLLHRRHLQADRRRATATSSARASGSASASCGSPATSRSCRRPRRSTPATSTSAGCSPPRANGEEAAAQAADSFCAGVSQDIPIWENKVYRDPPVITRTEKLILEHRRWSQQFYSGLRPAGPSGHRHQHAPARGDIPQARRLASARGRWPCAATACTSDPDEASGGGSDRGRRRRGTSRSSTEGLTDDTIKIGVIGADFGALAEAGLAPDLGDQPRSSSRSSTRSTRTAASPAARSSCA